MAVLGAIICGGQSRRFGSDKAAALIDGVALIDHIHAALEAQVDAIVVCGRQWRDRRCVPDLPAPDLGPLGGLNAAMAYGLSNGYEWVLSLPVDTFPLPANLLAMLPFQSACFADQRLIGIWPTSFATMLSDHLRAGHRSVRSWVAASGTRMIEGHGFAFTNVNTPEDMPAAAKQYFLQDGRSQVDRRKE